MFSRNQKEVIFMKARDVSANFPASYGCLTGIERLAVLPVLDEPIQSTLHSIIQQKVNYGTKCLYKGCNGYLDRTGKCSNDCSESGVNIVQDIISCYSCDTFCFPCPKCYKCIFDGQLKMYLN